MLTRGICFIILLALLEQCSPSTEQSTKVPSAIEAKKKFNVVLIMSDDQGYGDFGFTGNEYIQTPTLDSLKEISCFYSNFYVSPVCAPTRASLLTGRWHFRTGVSGVTGGHEIMRPDEYTIAELFRDNGYKTGCFGKWHNGAQYPFTPRGQGFEEFCGFISGHWNNYINTTLNHNGIDKKFNGYITDVLTDQAISFIEKNESENFFCYVPYNVPHSPFQVPDAYFDKYKEEGLDDKNACVYGMIENMDQNIARIFNCLRKNKLSDNTIVVFLSDNGPNGHRYNCGLKGIKASVDEGGIKVPMFMLVPGQEAQQITTPAAHIDIMPTLEKICRLENKGTKDYDGTDLRDLQSSHGNRHLFSHWSGLSFDSVPGSVRDSTYRFVKNAEGEFLYNLLIDPGQKYNLIDSEEYAPTLKRLKREYYNWLREVTADGIVPPPSKVGFTDAPKTKISAHELDFSGNVRYYGKMGWANDWLINFQESTDVVTSEVDVVSSGTYKVLIDYCIDRSVLDAEASFVLGTEALSKTLELGEPCELVPSPDRIPRKEVYEQIWHTESLGVVTLTETGTIPLKLSFKNGSNIHLKSVSLEFLSD